MNQAQLAAELGVSPAAISQWTRAGLPHRVIARRRNDYNADEARAWCLVHGKALDSRLDRKGLVSTVVLPATAPRGDLVAWLHSAFGRNGVEPVAWLAVEVDVDPAAAAQIWWNCASSLFSALATDLGADPLLMPEPAAPDVAAVAARLAEIKATWTE